MADTTTYRATDGSGNKAIIVATVPAGGNEPVHLLGIMAGPNPSDLKYVGNFADHALAVQVAERFLGCDVVLPGCASWY